MTQRANKKYFSFVVIAFVLACFAFAYINYLDEKKSALIDKRYKEEAMLLEKKLESKLLHKQNVTFAIALSLAQNGAILDHIEKKEISEDYFEQLIEDFKRYTLYKNIWLMIVDERDVVLVRSWDTLKGDLYKDMLGDPHTSIGVNKYDLVIQAHIPFYKEGRLIGRLEVLSHFNSIAKSLQEESISSVVLVDKKVSQKILKPFSKKSIKGYYIANGDASEEMIEYLKTQDIQKIFDGEYLIQDGYLIVPVRLHNEKGQTIASFVMCKKLKGISTVSLDYYMFKWLVVSMIIVLGVILMLIIWIFVKNIYLKDYYKNIINSLTNVIVITDGVHIISANKLFFAFLNGYKTLEEFQKDYDCVCDFFEKEDGYLQKEMDGLSWLEYLIKHQDKYHKVKVKLPDGIYYFSVSASLISREENHYSIVFSNITEEEHYKRKVEILNITDPLTGIYNRRYFQKKLSDDIEYAKRYGHPLSLMMFDIDFFKKINDTYGHDVGDEVLVEYTRLIATRIRVNDSFCRIGGEEFVVILPNTSLENAALVAQKCRKFVEESGAVVAVTMSFGVVELLEDEDSDEIFKRVDTALYEAKESGRNKVVVH